MLESLKILVTGGSGFIGSHLVYKLVKKGCDVRCLVRKSSDTEFLNNLGVELVYGDITNRKSLESAVKGVDCIFHLAAALGVENLPENIYFEVNVKGVENLLNVCKESEVKKIIHCSSVGVYGPILNPPANENFPYNPSNVYEKSKCEGEKVAIRFMDYLPITIVQPPAIVYGPRDFSNMFKLFKAIKSGRFWIIGNGKNRIHLAYVENLIDGMILAAKKKNAIGQKYIIGDEKSTEVIEIVQTMASAMNVNLSKIKIPTSIAKLTGIIFELMSKIIKFDPPLTRERVDFLTKDRAYDISKAKSELGFKPKITLKKGIKRTVKWYEINGFL